MVIQFAAKIGFKTIVIARGKDKEEMARKLGAQPEQLAHLTYTWLIIKSSIIPVSGMRYLLNKQLEKFM